MLYDVDPELDDKNTLLIVTKTNLIICTLAFWGSVCFLILHSQFSPFIYEFTLHSVWSHKHIEYVHILNILNSLQFPKYVLICVCMYFCVYVCVSSAWYISLTPQELGHIIFKNWLDLLMKHLTFNLALPMTSSGLGQVA